MSSSNSPKAKSHQSFGSILKSARKEKQWSQGELSRRSHVSIRTIVDVEGDKQTNPRFDVVVRLSNALDEDPSAWLKLAGHFRVTSEKIEAVLNEKFRFESEADPSEFFTTLKAQLKPQTPSLLCVAYPANPRTIHRPDIQEMLVDLVERGLWIGMVFPYPRIPIEVARRKNLARFYRHVYDAVIILATNLKSRISDEKRNRIGVFCPRDSQSEPRAHYIMPLAGLADYRPTLIKRFYSDPSDKPKFEYEVAAWVTMSRDKKDRWLQVYPSDTEETQRYDKMLCWCDYFQDILKNCKPANQGWDKNDFENSDWELLNLG